MVRIKKTIGLLVICALSIFLTGCPEEGPNHDFSIEIVNNSEDAIVWYSTNSSMQDTSLKNTFPWYKPESSIIYPNTSESVYSTIELTKELLETESEHYYIFIYDSVQTIPWGRIRDEYIVAKRIDFESWEELEECNFTITYP